MHPAPLDARDPAFIRAHLATLLRLTHGYHDVSVSGWERLPRGRALIVGNHNGGIMSPDMFALMAAYWRRFGPDDPAYGLAHDLPFHLPLLGDLMARVGAVPASPANAAALLERDARVLVYPGGDLDAFRPYARRHEVVFGGRRGFVRVALRARAPVVPVVSVGAHEGFHVLTDGADFVRRWGLKRLARIEVLPVIAGLPWGLWVGPLPYLPWPVRMRIQLLDPIAWPDLDPSAADDEGAVRACGDEVRAAMQSAMDAMVREGGFGRRTLRDLLGAAVPSRHAHGDAAP